MTAEIDWQALIAAAWAVRENAYAPYSQFSVGAALQTPAGERFVGCNVENIAFPSGQCAEASAIGTLVSAKGATAIAAVVVATGAERFTWPCGQCRQKLAELAAPECWVVSVTPNAVSEPQRLTDLLPGALASLA